MSERGTGMTTQQMQAAPHGAMYIWPTKSSLSYANALAVHLRRSDLIITTPGILDQDAMRLRGRRLPAIIIDHATNLTMRQYDVLDRERKVCALIGSAA